VVYELVEIYLKSISYQCMLLARNMLLKLLDDSIGGRLAGFARRSALLKNENEA
jgi:hypothetical protein